MPQPHQSMHAEFETLDTFLKAHVSDENRKRSLSKISKLASGRGLNKPREAPSFRVGVTFPSLYSVNVEAVLQEARVWLPPNLDKSNGWAYQHPLNWLKKFQNASAPPLAPPSPPALPSPPAVVAVLAVKEAKAPTPSAMHQLLRTAGLCQPLLSCLKKVGKYEFMGKAHWAAIRAWTKTVEGREWIAAAGLDPDSFHLHHVKASSRGGAFSVFNCAFIPGGLNSAFGARDDEIMRTYVGKQACELSDKHANWLIEKTAQLLSQKDFKIATHQM